MTTVEIQKLLISVCVYIKGRKFSENNSILTHEATIGFNLACDFMHSEIMKFIESANADLIKKRLEE